MKLKDDTLNRAILVVGFFMMAFGFFVLYMFFLGRYAILFLLAIAAAILYTYLAMSYYYSKLIEAKAKSQKEEFDELMINTVHQIESKHEKIHKIITSIPFDQNLTHALKQLLPKITESTGSIACAVYISDSNEKLKLKYSVGFGKNIYDEFNITMGEGLIGAAMVQNEITAINNIPDDTKYSIKTVIGDILPKSVIVMPLKLSEDCSAAFVFASIMNYTDDDLELLNAIKDYLRILINLSVQNTK